jgi:hypothetical protein
MARQLRFFLVFAPVAAVSALCCRAGDVPEGASPQERVRNGHESPESDGRDKEPAPSALEIEIGPVGVGYWGGGTLGTTQWTDLAGAGPRANRVAEFEKVVLKIDGNSDPVALQGLLDAFRRSHGFFQQITLESADPERRFNGCEATLRLNKEVFEEKDPILLTLDITPDNHGMEAAWWLFSPERIRVQDAQGREFCLFRHPVSQGDGHVRSKVFAGLRTATVGLTSFVEPYDGADYVCPFPPGRYSATFHFTREHQDSGDCREIEDRLLPCAWGSRKSNTVSFTVVPRKSEQRPNAEEAFRAVSVDIDAGRGEQAVERLRDLLVGGADPQTTRTAIEQILWIRRSSPWDEDSFPHKGKSLRDRIAERKKKDEDSGGPRVEQYSEALALLHASEGEREAWFARFAEYHDWGQRDPKTRVEEHRRFQGFPHSQLFRYPQFEAILLRALRTPGAHPWMLYEIYCGLPGPKDARILVRYLKEHRSLSLEHFSKRGAPWALGPFLARCFDAEGSPPDDAQTLGAEEMDNALLAFEKCVGLDLGFQTPPEASKRSRARDAIQGMLGAWWRLHGRWFGATPGADDETILARALAFQEADEIWLATVRSSLSDREGVRLKVEVSRVIKSGLPRRLADPRYQPGEQIHVGFLGDAKAAGDALKPEAGLVILCLRRSDRWAEYVADRPECLWSAE